MTTKPKKTEKAKPTPAPARKAGRGDKAAQAKPPESAEDFDHVLRRLVAARDKLPHGG